MRVKQIFLSLLAMVTFLVSLLSVPFAGAEVVKIGLNYPRPDLTWFRVWISCVLQSSL